MTKKYEYKVEYFNANASQADINSGEAGTKVAEQMEQKLKEMSDSGYEYYGRSSVNVNVVVGCGEKGAGGSRTYPINIFRKEK